MKLKNKKTGEIIEKYPDKFVINSGEQIKQYNSLAELNEEWEDYEEPTKYWHIDADFGVCSEEIVGELPKWKNELKAWKRLKDKGFVFKGINEDDGTIKTGLSKGVSLNDCKEFYCDMELLFGGEG